MSLGRKGKTCSAYSLPPLERGAGEVESASTGLKRKNRKVAEFILSLPHT
jgi:hypothetical protein